MNHILKAMLPVFFKFDIIELKMVKIFDLILIATNLPELKFIEVYLISFDIFAFMSVDFSTC